MNSKLIFYRTLLSLFLPFLGLLWASAASPNLAEGQSLASVPDLDIILIIDESGSMWVRNDKPTYDNKQTLTHPGWRIVGANLLAGLLGVDISGAKHHLGVIMFGTEAKVVHPLGAITADQNDFQRNINKNHDNMGATDIVKALTLAKNELDSKGRLKARKAVIFLSDGICEPLANTTAAMTAKCNEDASDLAKTFAQKGYPIFTIALTDDASKKDPGYKIYENVWEQIALTTNALYFAPKKSEEDLITANITILGRLFETKVDIREPQNTPSEFTFDLESDLEQVEFGITKFDPSVDAIIIRPNQTTVVKTDKSVSFISSLNTEVYSIKNPEAGRWVIKLQGGRGKASALSIPFTQNKLKIGLLRPRDTHPAGKPMEIAIQVQDRNTTLVKDLQEVKVDIKPPEGVGANMALKSVGEQYVGQNKPTLQKGRHLLKFSSQKDTKIGVLDHEIPVNVILQEWIKLISPNPGATASANVTIPIRVQLMINTESMNVPDGGTQRVISARLIQSGGGQLEAIPLKLGQNGIYEGNLKTDRVGDYILRVEMIGKAATGESFEDVDEIPFRIAAPAATALPPPTLAPPTPTIVPPTATSIPPTLIPTATLPPPPPPPPPEPIPLGTWLMIVGVLTALVGGGGFAWLWANKPNLVGTLEVLNPPSDMPISDFFLQGKSAWSIGVSNKNKVSLYGDGIASKHAKLEAGGTKKSPFVTLTNLDASNPVRINGIEAVTQQALQNDDLIEIGEITLKYTKPESYIPEA